MEIAYLGRNNRIDIILKANNVAVDLANVTKITLSFGDIIVESTNQTDDPITWNKAGYATGEVRIALGAETVPAGTYSSYLVVHDTSSPDGIVWGVIPTEVLTGI